MINLAIIVGNLGADPERTETRSGGVITTFNVATTERWKGNDGQMQESTEWHRIVAWNNLGNICADYLRKGSRVYIEGKIQTRKWQDQQGNDRYTTEIVAREMKMLSPPQQQQQHGRQGGQHDLGGGYSGGGEDVPFMLL